MVDRHRCSQFSSPVLAYIYVDRYVIKVYIRTMSTNVQSRKLGINFRRRHSQSATRCPHFFYGSIKPKAASQHPQRSRYYYARWLSQSLYPSKHKNKALRRPCTITRPVQLRRENTLNSRCFTASPRFPCSNSCTHARHHHRSAEYKHHSSVGQARPSAPSLQP